MCYEISDNVPGFFKLGKSTQRDTVIKVNVASTNYSKDKGVGGKIILKWILEK
jgi:hypothetical protein